MPPSLQFERHGADGEVGVLRLCRTAKRNALDDPTVLGLEAFFGAPPAGVRVVVLDAEGDHFSAGLDLSELVERDVLEGVQHSMMWHRAFARIESGPVPVIAVLKGAVVGGGLELASRHAPAGRRASARSTHCRRGSAGCSSAVAVRCGCRG